MSSVRIEQTKYKLIFLLILAVVCMMGCIHLLTGEFDETSLYEQLSWKALIMTVLAILFLVVAIIYMIYSWNKCIVTIEDDGFTSYSTIATLGFIQWKNVEDIKVINVKEHKFIGVTVNNIDKLLDQAPWYVERIIQYNITKGYPHISISLQTAKEKPEEVLAIMNKFWNEWKDNNKKYMNQQNT